MGDDKDTKPNGEALQPEEPLEEPEAVAERLWAQVGFLTHFAQCVSDIMKFWGLSRFVAQGQDASRVLPESDHSSPH
jgi:hypothetical protein